MKTQRVRIYYPHFPFPPTEGSFYVAFDQIRALTELGFKVELVFWKNSLVEASQKMKQPYIDLFPQGVFQTSLYKSEGESQSERLWRVVRSLFSDLSSPEIYYYSPSYNPQSTEAVDLEIYNYSFSYAWLKRLSFTQSKKIVVFHNLESDLFEQRALEETSYLQQKIQTLNATKLRSHEAKLKDLVDEIWFVSPEDLQNYQQRNPSVVSQRFVPPGFSTHFYKTRVKYFLNRNRSQDRTPVLGWIGSLDYHPNQKSVLWVIQKLAPCLQKRNFQGSIQIGGRGVPDEILHLAQPYPFIHFQGFVQDLEEFWSQLDFSLVPHVIGSGVRIKLLESLASGIPTLATSGAVTRIHPHLRATQLLKVSDDPDEWADWIVSSQNVGLRHRLSDLGLLSELNSLKNYSFLKN